MVNEFENPYLSIVVTTRNDNHGGDLNERTQLFLNQIFSQCSKYKLLTELIIVEWNPPEGKPKLKDSLKFRTHNKYCQVRIIEVPHEIHKKYNYADRLPIYQMIAKNFGIRRAKGEFILVTNIDILFSDELIKLMSSKNLKRGIIYRVDRYDVDNNILNENLNMENEALLNYCKNNIIRINKRLYTESFINKKRYYIYHKDTFEICNQYKIELPPHSNACGDFQLMHKDDWIKSTGYVEIDAFSLHIDSLFQFSVKYCDIREEMINYPIYHIEHNSGFQPENDVLDKKLKSKELFTISYIEFLYLVFSMMFYQKQLLKNNSGWGGLDINLTESVLIEDSFVEKIGDSYSFESFSPSHIFDTNVIFSTIADYEKNVKVKELSLYSSCLEQWLNKLTMLNKLININRKGNEYGNIGIRNKDIIIFGGSLGYINFVKPVLESYNVRPKFIVDNDINKHGKFIDGIEIKSVKSLEMETKENCMIIVASSFYEEIVQQLNSMDFEENKDYVVAYYYLDITTLTLAQLKQKDM